MKSIYYYHDGKSQEGPFTLDEMLTLPIKPNTPIWKEGEPDWKEAANFPELTVIFISTQNLTPPPFTSPKPPEFNTNPPAVTPNVTSTPTPKSSGNRRMFRILLILLFSGLGVIFLMNTVFRKAGGYSGYESYNERTSTATYQEKKLSVLEVERANPVNFLKADGTYNRTLFGQKIKVHGKVTNKATVANFKDITIEVVYYSETNSEIERERFVLYSYVPAHSTKNFEWKIKPPGGTSTVGWNVIDAVPY